MKVKTALLFGVFSIQFSAGFQVLSNSLEASDIEIFVYNLGSMLLHFILVLKFTFLYVISSEA